MLCVIQSVPLLALSDNLHSRCAAISDERGPILLLRFSARAKNKKVSGGGLSFDSKTIENKKDIRRKWSGGWGTE